MAAINTWSTYMRTLAVSNTQVDAGNKPHAWADNEARFISNAAKNSDDFILWTDTQNFLTSALPDGTGVSEAVILPTAFSVLKPFKTSHTPEEVEAVYDQCEALAWVFFRKMTRDAGTFDSENCVPISHVYANTFRITRDGIYPHNHIGVTAQIQVKIRKGAPLHNPDNWN